MFELADRRQKTLYVRSIFLQGLLLLEGKTLPPAMFYAVETVDTFGSIAEKYGLTRQALAMGYAKCQYHQAKIIFGAETSEQIVENLRMWRSPLSKEICISLYIIFRSSVR